MKREVNFKGRRHLSTRRDRARGFVEACRFVGMSDDEIRGQHIGAERKDMNKEPTCHFTPMIYQWADDGCEQVEYWECQHCGHTKEICRHLAG